MSQLRSRLEHLTPALSAKQRFLFIVRASRAGTPVEPDPCATCTPSWAGPTRNRSHAEDW